MKDLVIAWKVSPTHVLRVHCDVLHIADPEPNESKEGTSSFAHSLLPAIVSEHFGQLRFCLGECFIFLYDLVEVVLPVEHQTEGCFTIDLNVLCWDLVEGIAEAELSASPFLDLRVISAGNCR